MSNILTVSELNSYVKERLEKDHNLINIAVQGEISNLTNHSTGHQYFTIKDSKSQLKAIMFSSHAKSLKFKLKEGLKIIAYGSIKLYEPQGSYSIQIINMTLDGVGELYLKYEELKANLAKKGWFDQSIKKPIPKFPQNIGIITAPTGAAIRDLITTINRRYPLANVYLFPSLVQGKDAKNDIVNKIKAANNFSINLDTLIIGRGGGSIEDLWAFNEIEVVQAIYECPIPVISAVGHEIDFTLADFVSDLRAPTPTAAGELATPDQRELKTFLQQEYRLLIHRIKQKVDNYASKFQQLKNNYIFTNPLTLYQNKLTVYQNIMHRFETIKNYFFNDNSQIVNRWYTQLINNFQHLLYQRLQLKNQLIRHLDLLSPLKTLSRGYSVTYNSEKKIIPSIENIKVNDTITTRINDGLIHSLVTRIEENA